MHIRHRYLSVLFVLFMLSPGLAAANGYLVVALVEPEMSWTLFIQKNGEQWEAIVTEHEPRTPAYSAATQQLVYADSDGSIRLRKNGVEQVIFQSTEKHKFTQPVFNMAGSHIYMVQLIDGSSIDTDIVIGDLNTGKIKKTVTQRSVQFEPFVTNEYLYYSSVSCVPPECHRIIEDIWRINPVAVQVEQLTRLNAIGREPIVSTNGELYFISDVNGRFRLHQLVDGLPTPIAPDIGSDSSPGITESGNIVFINRTRSQADTLKQWSVDSSEVSDIVAPLGSIKLRDFSTW